ncbi:hypothetical protein BCF46_2798 [Litoreibacter meonggei]|uniref:Secreted protein n=1 Tax=Litoreibacter meonggei TaxID=1049199 RepID=A0A497VMC2_9RHOB|nr:hypothetical protein BCF46_2798 [Litoreibacter meonggei]
MFRAFSLLFLLGSLASAVSAQDDGVLSTIGMCRIDGVSGGNISVASTVSTCWGSPESQAYDRAQNRSHELASEQCPSLDAANAASRCADVGKDFVASNVPSVQVTREDGIDRAERGAEVVTRIDNTGRCTISRQRGATENSTSGSCWPFGPRPRARVTVRSYCGYVCQ